MNFTIEGVIEVFCSKCGKPVQKTNKFCSSCGASIVDIDSSRTELTKQGAGETFNEVREQIEMGKESGKLYLVFGWVSTIVSLLFIPVLFGAIAVIMGYLYRFKDEKMGTILMIAGVAGGMLGVLIGMSAGY